MFGPKKLDVYEDENNLTITYKWFTPASIFMLMFCIFWDGFLLFWYTAGIATGGPLIMFLFPLIHVLAGVGLTYSTLCNLFNKTIIDVSYDRLNIVHRPIPWWKGNQSMSTDDIEQMYVKELKKNSQNGNTIYSYELRAKLKNGEDIVLFSNGSTESEQIQKIEERLEQFIGINDYPVKGEYGSKLLTPDKKQAPKPRRRRKTVIGEHPQYDLQEGDTLAVRQHQLIVNHITQYDWNTGDTDKLIQLLSATSKENLLYVKQKKGLFTTLVEQELPLFAVQKIEFDVKKPPVAFQHEGKQFLKTSYQEGNAFRGDLGEALKINQWIYTETVSNTQIRIVANGTALSFYRGKPIPENYFSNPVADNLELRDLDEEMELRDNNVWDEEFE